MLFAAKVGGTINTNIYQNYRITQYCIIVVSNKMSCFDQACFDVRQSPKVWKRLAAQQQLEGNPDVEWLSTHPSHATRANNLESLLPEVRCFKCYKLGT